MLKSAKCNTKILPESEFAGIAKNGQPEPGPKFGKLKWGVKKVKTSICIAHNVYTHL